MRFLEYYLLVENPDNRNPDSQLWWPLNGETAPDFQGPGINIPEFGPGYQIARFGQDDHSHRSHGDYLVPGTYLIFNAELFVKIPEIPSFPDPDAVRAAIDPARLDLPTATSYRDFIRIVNPHPVAGLPCPPDLPTAASPTEQTSGVAATGNAPYSNMTRILMARTAADEIFWRLSAYENDRRITAQRGVTAGTFVTTNSDLEVVGSGLSAVGRYALPNPFPAIYAYRILPNRGTPITIGTARPDFGQAGGGVEAVLEKATKPWCVANHLRVLPAW